MKSSAVMLELVETLEAGIEEVLNSALVSIRLLDNNSTLEIKMDGNVLDERGFVVGSKEGTLTLKVKNFFVEEKLFKDYYKTT
jgi:hypothetical protein